jgi:hypothetical protein
VKTISNIIVNNRPVSGVYWIGKTFPEADLETLKDKLSPKIYHIKGSRIRTSEEFLNTAREAMDAPEPCTYNWDMFRDCMRSVDLPSAPNPNHIFVYDGIETFAMNNPIDFQIAIQVMIDATGVWRERLPEKRIYVLLIGDKMALESIPNTYSWFGKEIINDFWLFTAIE